MMTVLAEPPIDEDNDSVAFAAVIQAITGSDIKIVGVSAIAFIDHTDSFDAIGIFETSQEDDDIVIFFLDT